MMSEEKIHKRPISNTIIILLVSVVFLYGIFQFLTPNRTLPVYNPADINPDLVDESVKDVTKNHKVLSFLLINQNGKTITEKDCENKIYVTDFFFTTCKTICPVMTNNIALLQDKFKTDKDIKFLSISVTPNIDSVSVLKEYANKYKAIDEKWNITTGNKRHIYNLARKSYFATLNKGDGGVQDFIHTENFVLIDKQKQIRGIYNGTDDEEMQILIKDIQLLQKEEVQ